MTEISTLWPQLVDQPAPAAVFGAGQVDRERAILRTLVYADVFHYPLTVDELCHWSIGLALTPDAVRECLAGSAWLAERVELVDGYLALRGRAGAIVPLRVARGRCARALWPAARRYAWLVGRLPFVRSVAVTGALALDNVDAGADVDLMIVTAPHRVWLVRALAIALVRLARLEGVKLCPNYVLAESALAQQRQDLFIAHEIVQLLPVVGPTLYAEFLAANAWCARFLPNAGRPWRAERDLTPGPLGRAVQRLGELALGGPLGARLENWERERKLRKFEDQARRSPASAILDEDQVKGHFMDYGAPALAAYRRRLEDFGLAE